VGNRAILRRQTGDLTGALACLDKQVELTKVSGNLQGYIFATVNRGAVLAAVARVDVGRRAKREARDLAVKSGLTPLVGEIDRLLASMRSG
jgi:hypothetical protein